MHSKICSLLNIDFPLIAFSHCRDVVVEVSKAGGMGVLGAVGMRPETLAAELDWIDANIDGKPYGVDLIVPARHEAQAKGQSKSMSREDAVSKVPQAHRAFVRDLLEDHNIPSEQIEDNLISRGARMSQSIQHEGAQALLDVAFDHPIGLIANAPGPPPAYMIERARAHGVSVAALVGAREHAIRQVEAGVDIIVVSGGEAGGHCGDVSTLVLVPEVVRAIRPISDAVILAAGGIVTGEQMAACMAMGADGAWTGSVWLTTTEAETSPAVKEKMLKASSRDTVRSKARTGKFSRQLRSAWTDAWEGPDAPAPLPLPFQSIIVEPTMQRINKLAEGGHDGATQLASYFVGQGVGLMNETVSARDVVRQFMEDYLEATDRLRRFVEDD